MGQKAHPTGLRLGIVKTWKSKWFATRNFADLLQEDLLIRKYANRRLEHAGIALVEILRAPKKVTIDIHTARPGIVIGRKGAEVDNLKGELELLTGKEILLNVIEVKKPELSANLVGAVYRQAARRQSQFPSRHEESPRGYHEIRRRGNQDLPAADVLAERKSRATRSIMRGAFLCIRSAPISITLRPQPTPPTAPSVSRFGSASAKSSATRRSRPRPTRDAALGLEEKPAEIAPPRPCQETGSNRRHCPRVATGLSHRPRRSTKPTSRPKWQGPRRDRTR